MLFVSETMGNHSTAMKRTIMMPILMKVFLEVGER